MRRLLFQEKNVLVGTVNIPVANVNSRSLIEKWYQVQNDARAPSKDQAALRIKCKFQSIDILPMEMYSDFIQVGSKVTTSCLRVYYLPFLLCHFYLRFLFILPLISKNIEEGMEAHATSCSIHYCIEMRKALLVSLL